MYRRFGGKREFKKYLHGRSDEGARLLFKFRSGTHGLNEELGRHSDMHEGNSSLTSFTACIEDDLREREAEEFRKDLIVR